MNLPTSSPVRRVLGAVIAILALHGCGDRAAVPAPATEAPASRVAAAVGSLPAGPSAAATSAPTAARRPLVPTQPGAAALSSDLLVEDGPADAAGRVARTRVAIAGGKYPLTRREEVWQGAPGTAGARLLRSVDMVADHVVVRLAPGHAPADLAVLVAPLGGAVLRQRPGSTLALVGFDGTDLAQMRAVLRGLSSAAGVVALAEPDYVVRAGATPVAPNDPLFPRQWALNNTGQTGGAVNADINAPQAWALATGSRAVKVGVIDSGIDYNHPDLAPNIWINPGETGLDSQGRDKRFNGVDDDGDGLIDDWHGWNFVADTNDPMDDFFHGTHVAGTIAAAGNNGGGVSGICWQATLVPLKFLDSSGSGYTSDAVDAVSYATRLGVTLTSNSWGGGGFSQALKDAIDAAGAAGILFVAAAGNDASDNDAAPTYPASYASANVIAVAATDANDRLATFSNHGATSVHVAAPGVDVLSTLPTVLTAAMQQYGLPTTYGTISGTSMATPHVSGALALLESYLPGLTATQLRARLLQRSARLASLLGEVQSGARVDLFALLDPAWVPSPAQPQLAGVAVTDEGNHDDAPNPGEVVDLLPTFTNVGAADATGCTCTLTSPTSGVTVLTTAAVSIGTIPSFGQAAPVGALRLRLAASMLDGQAVDCVYTIASGGKTIATLHGALTVTTSQPTAYAPTGFPVGELVADAARNLVYVVDAGTPAVIAVSTRSGRVAARGVFTAAAAAPAPSRNGVRDATPLQVGGLAIAHDGKTLFACLPGLAAVQSFSLPGLIPQQVIPVGFPPLFIATGANGLLYCSSVEEWDPLRAVDPATGAVVATIGSFYAAYLHTTEDGKQLFAGDLGLSGYDDIIQYDITATAPTVIKSHSVVLENLEDLDVDVERQRLITMQGGVYALQLTDLATEAETEWPLLQPYGSGTAHRPGAPEVYGTSSSTIEKFRASDGLRLRSFPLPTEVYNATLPARGLRITANDRLIWSMNDGSRYYLGIIGAASLTLGNAPHAVAVADHPVGPLPLKVTFDASASSDPDAGGRIASYAWRFSDGTTASGAKPVKTFTVRGCYSATLTVTDAEGATDTTIVTVIADAGPIAKAQSVTTREDTAKAITLVASDADHDALTWSIVTPPAKGALSGAPPALVYTPAANANGGDAFSFTVNDGLVESAPAQVAITITPVNDPPVARSRSLVVKKGGSAAVALAASDVEGDPLTLRVTAQPAHGALTGTIPNLTYTPTSAYEGGDAFSYVANDGKADSAPGVLNILVVGTAPTGTADWPTFGGAIDHAGARALSLASFAAPVTGWTAAVGPGLNQVSVAGGRVIATAGPYFNGPMLIDELDADTGAQGWQVQLAAGYSLNQASIDGGQVFVQHGDSSYDTQLVSLNLQDGATLWSSPFSAQWERYLAPCVSGDGVYIDGGSYGGMYGFDRYSGAQRFFAGGLAQVDEWTPAVDTAGDLYSWVNGAFSQHDPATGVALWTLNLNGSNGGSMNTAAVLVGGRAYLQASAPGTIYAVDLASHAVVWSTAAAVAGTPAVANGVVYVPVTGGVLALKADTGVVVGTYATSGYNTGNQPIVLANALLASTSDGTSLFQLGAFTAKQVLPASGGLSLAKHTLYVAGSDGVVRTWRFANRAPVAGPFSASVHAGGRLPLTLPGSDADHDPLTWTVKARPAHGALSGTAPTLTYIPAAGFSGTDTFTYVVNDGLADSAVGTATITVTDAAPVAVAQSIGLYMNSPRSLTLGASDADGDALSYAVASAPAHGTLSGTGKALTYTPAANYLGADSFTFHVSDGVQSSAAATVTLSVVAFHANVNFQPAAAPVPAGYLPDSGLAYAARNGQTYGWKAANEHALDRDAPASPDQRYDTFNLMQPAGVAMVWEMSVPNGTYDVHVVCGDPLATDSVYRLNVEGVLAVSGTPTTANHWVSSPTTLRVVVTDGRLTVTNASGASNGKICYLDLRQVPSGNG